MESGGHASERRRHLESLKRMMRGHAAVIDLQRMLEYYHTLSSEDQPVFWKTAQEEVEAELNKDDMADDQKVCCRLFRLCRMGYK
ncbi:UL30 [Papio ursinus cytomegalovirus]|uniref:UL30 n=1 Tax=Papiine betaherpesvirus 4 TaxID=2560624 RepID=A0A0F7GBA9_9BETA|nr:UL30 [Papio ursinus cytomegalovirus]AKG51626.1 UL30 [Papiine betaherpesvirus 4]